MATDRADGYRLHRRGDHFHTTGHDMGQLRTANKRHNRAIIAAQAAKTTKAAPVAPAKKPAKSAA